MKLNAPKYITWVLAVILGLGGILGTFFVIPIVSTFSFWLVVLGWLLLVLATYLKGL